MQSYEKGWILVAENMISMREALEGKTTKELTRIARKLKIQGRSRKSKSELIELILSLGQQSKLEKLLYPSLLHRIFDNTLGKVLNCILWFFNTRIGKLTLCLGAVASIVAPVWMSREKPPMNPLSDPNILAIGSEIREAISVAQDGRAFDPDILAIRSEIRKVVSVAQDESASDEQKRLAANSLLQYQSKAVPEIFSYAGSLLCGNFVDGRDPNYLAGVRDQIEMYPGANLLLQSACRIIIDSNDPLLLQYASSLLREYEGSEAKKKEALIFSYCLWCLPYKPYHGLAAQLLEDNRDWDPVKRVLLRGLLSARDNSYALHGTGERTPPSVTADGNHLLSAGTISSLGCELTTNAGLFVDHLENSDYPVLQEVPSEGVKVTSYEDIKAQLEPWNALYLFGFDFYGVPLYKLRLSDILLGKSCFRSLFVEGCVFDTSTLLECDFSDTSVSKLKVQITRFVGCNFQGASISGSLFRRARFDACRLSESTLDNSALTDSIFVGSDVNEMHIGGAALLLGCTFESCSGKLNLRGVIVDADTLDSLRASGLVSFSDIRIEQINVNEVELNFEKQTVRRDWIESPTPEYYLQTSLFLIGMMSNLHSSDFDTLKAQLAKKRLFLINRPISADTFPDMPTMTSFERGQLAEEAAFLESLTNAMRSKFGHIYVLDRLREKIYDGLVRIQMSDLYQNVSDPNVVDGAYTLSEELDLMQSLLVEDRAINQDQLVGRNWEIFSLCFLTASWDLASESIDGILAVDPNDMNALNAKACLEIMDGRLVEASEICGQLVDLANKTESARWRVVALGNMACIQVGMGNTDEALRQYGEAISLSESLGMPLLQATLNIGLARCHWQGKRLSEAANAYEQAFSSSLGLCEPDTEFSFRLEYANLLNTQRRFQEALSSIQQALDLEDELLLQSMVPDALAPIAGTHLHLGNLQGAKKAAERILSLVGEDDTDRRNAFARSRLGMVHSILENFSLARSFFTESARLHEASGRFSDAAYQYYQLGLLGLAESDPDAEASMFGKMVKIAKQVGGPWSTALANIAIARIRNQEGRWDLALDMLQQAKMMAKGMTAYLPIGDICEQIGSIHMEQGNYEDAEESLLEALDLAKEEMYAVKAHRLVVMARLRRKQGQTREALNCLRETLEMYGVMGAEVKAKSVQSEIEKTMEHMSLDNEPSH